ncbi:hypothetical protein ACUNWD_13580 [Sunxiuqinia sp. A32]|uniref:hypothetical protein n=1 Tax=Sunxiuqinia sp. A32 TaxID=3461496 RepID=UPI0040466EFC
MTIPFRPLAEVKMMLEETGNDVSYAYDDLIFPEHTAFLIQFDDEKANNLKVFFNREIEPTEITSIEKNLTTASKKRKLTIESSGKFSMEQKEDTEEIELKFFPI